MYRMVEPPHECLARLVMKPALELRQTLRPIEKEGLDCELREQRTIVPYFYQYLLYHQI